MADKNVQDLRQAVGAPSTVGKDPWVVTYDFAEDGGANADSYVMITFEDACAARLLACRVRETVTSGGAATLDVGIDTGKEFFDGKDIAELTEGAVVMGDAPAQYFKVEDDERIQLDINVADLTAGKLEFYFEVIGA